MACDCRPFIEVLKPGKLKFPFHLWFKPARYGEHDMAHFWMDAASPYGQRGRAGVNHAMLIDYFLYRCALGGTAGRRANQETFLLAGLVPLARGNGSQRVL